MQPANENEEQFRAKPELSWVHHPTRELARLAWPIAVSTVSYALMTLADTLFVGRLGAPALAGVGLGGTAAFALLCFGFGVLRGVKIMASQALGAGRHAELLSYLGAGLLVGVSLGVLGMVGGQLVAELMPAVAASAEAGGHARVYLQVRSIGTPLVLIYVALREYRYGVGDSRSPMWAVIAANLVNVGLDWVFIFGLNMGVAGAAWASVVAHLVEVLILVGIQRGEGFGLGRVLWRHVRALWSVGLPSGLQFTLEVGSFAVMATMLAALSSVQMAAHQIALAVMHLTFLPALAISEAGSVLAGQAVGADRDGLVRSVARRAMAAAGGYAVLCTVVLVTFARDIGTGFTEEAAVLSTVVPLFWVAAVFQIADAGNAVARGILRGAGDVTWPAVVGIGCAWAFLPGLTWLLGYEMGLGALGAWMALCVEIIVGAALYWWRLERLGWLPSARRSRARLSPQGSDHGGRVPTGEVATS